MAQLTKFRIEKNFNIRLYFKIKLSEFARISDSINFDIVFMFFNSMFSTVPRAAPASPERGAAQMPWAGR